MNLFLYESLSAGSLGDDAPPSLRAEGLAMLNAAAADFAGVADVSTLLSGDVADIPGVRCQRTTVSGEPIRFNDAVDDSDAVLIIAPEFSDILAQRSEHVLSRRRRLIGCQPNAIRATADKFALAQRWAKRRVPTPATNLATREVPATFPVVLKPRDGAGSQAMRLVNNVAAWPNQLAEALREMPGRDFLVQPFHPGRACSVAFLVGPRQTLPLAPTEQILTDDGRFHYRGGRLPLSAEDSRRAVTLATAALERIAGLTGYVGVDLILGDDGHDVAIEINPRLTTSYIGLRALCRDNLAATWLRVLDGERDLHLSWRTGPVSFFADGRVQG